MRKILKNKRAFQFVLASLILIPFIIVGIVGLQQFFEKKSIPLKNTILQRKTYIFSGINENSS